MWRAIELGLNDGEEPNPVIWILFISFITAPLVCLFSLVFAWKFYTTEQYAVACYVSLIPWVNILLFVLTELFRNKR